MSAADRYVSFTPDELDAALTWVRQQGPGEWAARLAKAGDCLLGDLSYVPPVVRQIVREHAIALERMTPAQVRDLLATDSRGRVELVASVLAEAGR